MGIKNKMIEKLLGGADMTKYMEELKDMKANMTLEEQADAKKFMLEFLSGGGGAKEMLKTIMARKGDEPISPEEAQQMAKDFIKKKDK